MLGSLERVERDLILCDTPAVSRFFGTEPWSNKSLVSCVLYFQLRFSPLSLSLSLSFLVIISHSKLLVLLSKLIPHL